MAEKLRSDFFGCVNPCNVEWQKILNDQVKLDKGNIIEKWFLNDMGECDDCRAKFSFFKRKKYCSKCGLNYCSSCVAHRIGGERQCNKCHILYTWPINVDDISSLRVRDLRQFLNAHKIKTDTLREKRDLIELVIHQLKLIHDGGVNKHNQSSTAAGSSRSGPSTRDDGIRVRPVNISPPTRSEEVPTHDAACSLDTSSETGGIRVFASDSPSGAEALTIHNTNSDNSSSSDWSLLLPDGVTERLSPDIPSLSHSPNRETPMDGVHMDLESEIHTTSDNNESEVEIVQEEDNISQTQNLYPPLPIPTPPPPLEQASNSFNSVKQTLASDVIKLSSVEDEDSIKDLSVRQCKEILTLHRVDYSGVWEKHELISKVKMLWRDYKQRQEEKDIVDEQLCKICMDAVMDCVLLECGHIVSCTDCGKQLSECPICRQNVIRVVKTFRA